jgi:hypothetical protein
MEAWVGCLAGALDVEEYTRLLLEAGFEDVSVNVTRRYTVAETELDTSTLPDGWESGDGKLASAFVRASKPTAPIVTASAPTVIKVSTASSGGCCGGSGCDGA